MFNATEKLSKTDWIQFKTEHTRVERLFEREIVFRIGILIIFLSDYLSQNREGTRFFLFQRFNNDSLAPATSISLYEFTKLLFDS